MRRPDPPHISLSSGQTAVIGYGSLMSRASLERTLQRPYEGPFAPCHVEGWQRTWDISMPNRVYYFRDNGTKVYPERIAYLDVRPSPGRRMNAVIFVLDNRDLDAMHAREWIYEPVAVTDRVRDVTIAGGDALMYVGLPEHRVQDATRREATAIRASYLRILDNALAGADATFREEYQATTEPVPAHLVIEDALDTSS
ncbi:MAG TPA: gamma-glutamylcyclotransferase family protein [Vicinamibacterales bacterium]|nr:gamma-glutamylcyclotransferase family protein [Vicinamibacterales bacterium]